MYFQMQVCTCDKKNNSWLKHLFFIYVDIDWIPHKFTCISVLLLSENFKLCAGCAGLG